MSNDLETTLKSGGIESPLADPRAPFPGNLNTMDPSGWGNWLWEDVSTGIGMGGGGGGFYGRGSKSTYDAVGLSIAIQCADVKARDVAKAGMALWKKVARKWEEVEPRQHWFAKMLARRPNEYMTWGQFWRMTVMHYELMQNAYILKGMDRAGNILELIPLLPARVRERTDDKGDLWYEVSTTNEFERGKIGGVDSVIVPAYRMIHIKGRLWNGINGMSNVALGDPIFKLLTAVSDYQTNLFANDATTPLVFETDHAFTGDMADAAFRRLKEQLGEKLRKTRQNSDPLLLEAGLKAKEIAINSRDAMTAETFNSTVMRICGLMQTPPHKIFALETVKYDNQSAANQAYATDCLIPIADNFEETLRNSLLDEDTEWDTHWPEFDRMNLMASDVKTLSDVLDKALKNGAIEINEYRTRLPLALNPIEGGDVRYVPVNMAIVDREGNIIHQAATGQNEGAGAATDDEDKPKPNEDDEDGKNVLRLVHGKGQ